MSSGPAACAALLLAATALLALLRFLLPEERPQEQPKTTRDPDWATPPRLVVSPSCRKQLLFPAQEVPEDVLDMMQALQL